MSLPRIPTAEFARAIGSRSGPLYIAAIEAAGKWNPDLSNDEIVAGLDDYLSADILSSVQRIKIMPHALKIDGNLVPVFEDPMTVLSLQAKRLDAGAASRKSQSGCATVFTLPIIVGWALLSAVRKII